MTTNKLLKVIFISGLIAAIALALADHPSNAHTSLTCFLIVAGFVAGILTFNSNYTKDYLFPAFVLIFIYFAGGNTVLNDVSLRGMSLGESFTGLYKFIVSLTIVVCCKEIFSVFRD